LRKGLIRGHEPNEKGNSKISYAKKTFEDSNRIKRFFQNSRLEDAIRLVPDRDDPDLIVDFGAGNGELCKRLSGRFPNSRILCYEPHPELQDQARQNLEGADNIAFISDPSELPRASAGLLFCLEVFEHLPEREFNMVMDQVWQTLADGGSAIIGVPIEVGIPALYKGLFRMFRRFGDFDARPMNILAALLGRVPADRPVVELMPGSYYHVHHLGFDYRRFRKQLSRVFKIGKTSASPFSILGATINSELHYVVSKRVSSAQHEEYTWQE